MKFTKEDPKAEQRLKRKELKKGEIYSCIHATEGTYFMPIDINGAPYLINIVTGNLVGGLIHPFDYVDKITDLALEAGIDAPVLPNE